MNDVKKGNIQRSGQKSVCLLPVLFGDVASSRVRQKRRYKVRTMPPARQDRNRERHRSCRSVQFAAE